MLGDRIKELRESKNINQEDLCKILNIEQATLSNYERNRRIPNLNMLIKIADYFKVSLDYLCGRYNN